MVRHMQLTQTQKSHASSPSSQSCPNPLTSRALEKYSELPEDFMNFTKNGSLLLLILQLRSKTQ